MQAFQEMNVDPSFYLRERDANEALPWDHLSCGIPKSYFLREYQRAVRTKTTADCLTESCSVCGACNYDTRRNVLFPRDEAEAMFHRSIEFALERKREWYMIQSQRNLARYTGAAADD